MTAKYLSDLNEMGLLDRPEETHLTNERGQPDAWEEEIFPHPRKCVPLTVNFSRVDLVEKGHHHEGVEYRCEVSIRSSHTIFW